MPTYERAFSTKTSHTPTAATRTPAMAGPTARAALMATLLSATADGISSCGTSSGTIADHAGSMTALPTPRTKTNPSSIHAVITSSKVRIPSAPATISK